MKISNKQNPYPINLLLDFDSVNEYDYHIDLDHLSKDQIEGLKYAITTLKPRNQLILACRYEDNMTMREIGERLGVSRYNCLRRAGIQTVGALYERYMDTDNFCKIRNLGVKSRVEVEECLFSFWYKYLDMQIISTPGI